jgi:hypothetical protein
VNHSLIVRQIGILQIACFNMVFLELNEGVLIRRRDRLTMVYFDNLDNGPLNKYKKNHKNGIFFYKYVLLPLD